jgi:hypothetical protein
MAALPAYTGLAVTPRMPALPPGRRRETGGRSASTDPLAYPSSGPPPFEGDEGACPPSGPKGGPASSERGI